MSINSNFQPSNIQIKRDPVRIRLVTGDIINAFFISAYEEINGDINIIEDSSYYEDFNNQVRIDINSIVEVLQVSVSVGDTNNTVNNNYSIWISPENVYVYSYWNNQLNGLEFFNLDGTVYQGNINLLIQVKTEESNCESIDVQVICVNGIETVFRVSFYTDVNEAPVIFWQNALGELIPRPQGSLKIGACQVKTCCRHQEVWEFTGECYRPLHLVGLFDGDEDRPSTAQYFDIHGRVYFPVNEIVYELPNVTYQDHSIFLLDNQEFDISNYDDVSGISVSCKVPKKGNGNVIITNNSGDLTITENFQHTINAHSDKDKVTGIFKVRRNGENVRVMIGIRIRKNPRICA
jgi:L-rhamnose mutarotase